MIRVLIDTNILLDVILHRDPWRFEAQAIWNAVRDGRLLGLITATTVTDVHYLVRRAVHGDAAIEAIRECVDLFTVVAIGDTQLRMALALPGSDFEDNVQIAAAMSARVDAIVTRDTTGFRGSPIEALLPGQLLERLR